MSAGTITVPANLVGYLRSGVQNQLVARLDTLTVALDGRINAKTYQEALDAFDATRTLFDPIGVSNDDTQQDLELDLGMSPELVLKALGAQHQEHAKMSPAENNRTDSPTLAGVQAAPSSSVKHLGLGGYVLVESTSTESTPVAAVLTSSVGHERVVVRAKVNNAILKAIETHPRVKVARCSARGEPSSAYISCDAEVLAPDAKGRSSEEYMLNVSVGFVRRLADRLKGSAYEVIVLTPVKEPATSPERR